MISCQVSTKFPKISSWLDIKTMYHWPFCFHKHLLGAVAELQGGPVGPRTTLRSAHARPIAIGKFESSVLRCRTSKACLSVYPSERPARPFTNSRSATPDPSYTYLSMRLPAPLRIPTVPPCAVLVCFVIRTTAAAAAPSGERRAAAHASPQIRLSKSSSN